MHVAGAFVNGSDVSATSTPTQATSTAKRRHVLNVTGTAAAAAAVVVVVVAAAEVFLLLLLL